jgi:hypothetical protein
MGCNLPSKREITPLDKLVLHFCCSEPYGLKTRFFHYRISQLPTLRRETLKIRIPLLIIAFLLVVGTMAFGMVGTGAWFSDTKTSSVSVVASGSLDLQLVEDPLPNIHLKPGEDYSPIAVFCTRNIGSTDLKFRGLFEAAAPSSNDLIKFMTMKIESKTQAGWLTLKEILGSPTVEGEDLVYYFKFPGQNPKIVNQYIVVGSLAPQQYTCYRLSVKLDAATPDYDQNQSINFILNLFATQTTNPGWY